MLHYLLNFLYPPRCAACDAALPIDATRRVCASCLAAVEPPRPPLCLLCGAPLNSDAGDERCDHCRAAPPAFDSARAITRYRSGAYGTGTDGSSAVAALLRRHKYGLDQSLGRALAEYLDAGPALEAGTYDVVIPVPLHRTRLRWRGFNQAALLGVALARRLNCPLDVATLARVHSTPSQTARDRAERRRNVRDAFAVRRPLRVAGQRVLLVDDVMTTGATADECARMLRAAGARRIDVLTLARVL
ncbi:MAG TPA: ComF family protein [Candidatus Binataceae bacterium]|jgi:ComF family protein|nr:ComF family protein [Candidatus Binataceae bacterium]